MQPNLLYAFEILRAHFQLLHGISTRRLYPLQAPAFAILFQPFVAFPGLLVSDCCISGYAFYSWSHICLCTLEYLLVSVLLI